MSTSWLDAPEVDGIDVYGGDEGAEGYFEDMNGDGEAFAESYDDAEATSTRDHRRRRRARARRLARARRRAALARARYGRRPAGPTTAAAVVRKTEAEVANLDVETKVHADAVDSQLAAQAKRIRAAETATAASAIVNPLQRFLEGTPSTSELAKSPLFKAGLPLAPLLLLRPAKRGEGPEALVADPRVWAVAALAGLGIVESRRGNVKSVQIVAKPVTMAKPGTFTASAFDGSGVEVADRKPIWRSTNPGIATVDATGVVTGVTKDEPVIITATIGGVTDSTVVTVK